MTRKPLPLAHSQHKSTGTFTVQISVVKSTNKVTMNATCSICSEILDIEALAPPLSFIRVNGDLTKFKQEWFKAFKESANWRTPIIVDSSVEFITPTTTLQEALATHTLTCPGAPR